MRAKESWTDDAKRPIKEFKDSNKSKKNPLKKSIQN